MKKLTMGLFIFLVSIFLINACKDNSTEPEDDSDGNESITSISGTISYWPFGDTCTVKLVVDTTDTKDIFIVGESSVSASGNFNISNLKTVPDNFLTSISDDPPPEGITYDNPDLKFTLFETFFYVYAGNGLKVGELFYAKNDSLNSQYISGIFCYSNSNAKITGSSQDENEQLNVNLNFKKGWNLCYAIISDNGNNTQKIDLTSTHQDGLQWYFDVKGKNTAVKIFNKKGR